MGKYITNFATTAAFEAAESSLIKPHVSLTRDNMGMHYLPYHDFSQDYLTFVAKEQGTFTFTPKNNNVISYSIDDGSTWHEGNSVGVNSGDKVIWKGTMTPAQYQGIGSFSASTNSFDVQGNAMSLLYGDNFKGQTDLSGKNYAFYSLFYGTKVVNAENLSLPATTLATDCYSQMLSNCRSLVTVPELSATTLADSCYYYMFAYCTSLVTAPELPATTLAQRCYRQMFSNCTGLTTAPELPVTTLAQYCYEGMFAYCTSLETAPELPATTLADDCYYEMFKGCRSLVTAPELPATTLAPACYFSMFSNCKNLTTAPELPATTLAGSCYREMFKGCTSLETAPDLPATTLVSTCYRDMFYDCSKLNSITCLATNISASDCTTNWVSGVSATGTFNKAESMSSWTTSVNGIPSGWTVKDEYSRDYLTTVALEDGEISFNIWKSMGTGMITSISYSTDNGETWTTTNNVDNKEGHLTISVDVSEGDKVLWKGDAQQLGYYDDGDYSGSFFSSDCEFNVQGNVMSMLYGDDFVGEKTLEYDGELACLFYDCDNNYEGLVVSAEHLVLPATTLTKCCYRYMFQNCTNLIIAPSELPATTLARNCYMYMFGGCTSLEITPELPATMLTAYCYQYMFYGCTSLVTAPELPATTLAQSCYSGMFQGCSNLSSITCLATNISASYCTNDWVDGVAASGTFTKATSMTNWTTGASGIPSGWTVQIDYSRDYLTFVAKENGTFTFTPQNSNIISYSTDDGSTWTNGNSVQVNNGDKVMWKGTMTPASSQGIGSFSASTKSFDVQGNAMSLLNGDNFKNQTSLKGKSYAFYNLFKNTKVVNAENLSLPATTLAQSCYDNMFYGCTRLTSAPELPATTLAAYCYSYMFYGCTSLVTAPELPATTLEIYCYQYMFRNCTSLITAPELPAITLKGNCYQYMFYGCTSLVTAPELSATTLASYCYQYMFYNCTSLISAPELSATTLASYCYYCMFQGCTSLTTSPELPATTLVTYCYYYMFYGCTNLSSITCLATNKSASFCTYRWVMDVASSGTFTKAANMTSWTTDASGIPSGWTVQDKQ